MDRRTQARRRAALARNRSRVGQDLKTLPCGCREAVLTEQEHVFARGFRKSHTWNGTWALRVWRLCPRHWEEVG
jgi:hypothetical protein